MHERDESADEADLVSRAVEGDERAFGVLVTYHLQAVWRLSYHLLRDHEQAEEVVQDTFWNAWRRLSQFRGECSLRHYLYTICANACRTALDRRRRRKEREERLDLPLQWRPWGDAQWQGRSGSTAWNLAAASDTEDVWAMRIDLAAALARLPEVEREAFVLVKVMQQTEHEAARILAVPRTTVQARLGRARAKLAALLEGYQ